MRGGMMKMNVKKADSGKSDSLTRNFMIILKSSIFAVIVTLLFFIIFAIVMKIGNLDEKIIPPMNQIIRIISIALGGVIAARASNAKGWLKGAMTGVAYILWAFMISAVFGHRMSLDRFVISDIVMSFIVGAIGGIIGINLK